MNYGLQLYSVRDFTGNDLPGTLKKVAEMGYEFVEFAGFFGYTDVQIKAMLDENGLKAYATHCGTGMLLPENIDETIRFHKGIGCGNFIIPGDDFSTNAKIDRFIDIMNFAQPKLLENGIKLHYHNHSSEFFPNSEGRFVHTELEKRTNMLFEIDTYWVYNADLDPIATLERLKDRIEVIHLRDGLKGGIPTALGEGKAPVLDVLKKAKELGFKMIVEAENEDPDGLAVVKRCIDWLKKVDG
ncbi:MAG: sugar phosphate isomerase/epimerase [Clostridia bacterium]|nr:sugar phosphate isomerase/epimerase [Clostridia bacterium]